MGYDTNRVDRLLFAHTHQLPTTPSQAAERLLALLHQHGIMRHITPVSTTAKEAIPALRLHWPRLNALRRRLSRLGMAAIIWSPLTSGAQSLVCLHR